MGVSGYFKWLIAKYPNIMSKVIESHETDTKITDATEPNPNGFEIDNLYLDMNGIIHPCCHPEGEKQPESEEEMMVIIMQYLDRIFKAIRPRKLLYLAIDGVAPRAKMNQQRSRRYRSAKEAEKYEKIKKQHIADYERQGLEIPDSLKNEFHWDSNVITPGTAFMDKVATALRIYIQERITNDPAWRSLKIILTDSNSPGEGEHKIVQYIRVQRQQKNYNPNTSHCIHGLDADLIMLALATHEPHFYILREQIFDKGRPVDIEKKKAGYSFYDYKPLNFLHISVLREYLREDFNLIGLPFEYDFERIIDDYIFLCFFVGNDFLPHLPSIEIREGAIDMILDLYKKYLPSLGGYITDCGNINVQRAQLLLQQIGYQEDQIFQTRMQKERSFEERRKRNEFRSGNKSYAHQQNANEKNNEEKDNLNPLKRKMEFIPQKATKITKYDTNLMEVKELDTIDIQNKEVNEEIKLESKEQIETIELDEEPDITLVATINKPDKKEKEEINFEADQFIQSLKKKIQESSVVDKEKHPDDVRFGEQGWKQRYFKNKLGMDYDESLINLKVNHMLRSYFEGLGWVLKYYYEGCASWSWYYPYHYAPFASDLARVKDVKLEYELGTPFEPFTQLLAVFPKASAHALPPEFRKLMDDPSLSEFYPDDFEVDLNGKRFEWMGVALLPFIDEKKLIKAVKEVEYTLTEDEKERNSNRPWTIYSHKDHPISNTIKKCIESDTSITFPDNLDIQGTIFPMPKKILFEFEKPIEVPEAYLKELMQVKKNYTLSSAFELPITDKKHLCHLIPGLIFPKSFLSILRELRIEGDLEETALVFKNDIEGAKQHMRDHPTFAKRYWEEERNDQWSSKPFSHSNRGGRFQTSRRNDYDTGSRNSQSQNRATYPSYYQANQDYYQNQNNANYQYDSSAYQSYGYGYGQNYSLQQNNQGYNQYYNQNYNQYYNQGYNQNGNVDYQANGQYYNRGYYGNQNNSQRYNQNQGYNQNYNQYYNQGYNQNGNVDYQANGQYYNRGYYGNQNNSQRYNQERNNEQNQG